MTGKIYIALLCGIVLLSGGIVMAQNYNQLKMEDRPVNWQPPFPDEEFSFNRFKTQSEFNDYLEYRFPVGTHKREIDLVLVRIGGADPRIIVNPEMLDNAQFAVKYSKRTWRDFFYALAFMPPTRSFANFYFDRDFKLIKSFAVSPNSRLF